MKKIIFALFLMLSPALAADGGPSVGVTGPDAVMVVDAGVADAAVADAAVADAAVADAGVAPLPPTPQGVENAEDAAEAISFLVSAAKNGSWPLFAGVLVLLLIWILDKLVALKSRVPSKAVPWIAAAFGIAGSVAAAILAGDLSLGQALMQGFLGGTTSVGLWEMFFQTKKSDEPTA